jgi:hypothetical protein
LLQAAARLKNPLGRVALHAADKIPNAILNIGHEVADYALTPATTLGPAVTRGVSFLGKNMDVTLPLLAAAAAAPAVYEAAKGDYYRQLEETNAMTQDPGSVRIAHEVTLQDFLAKTAESRGFLGALLPGLAKGLGETSGKGLVDSLFSSAGSALSKIMDTPARKEIIGRLMTSDPVISDAVKRNPQMQRQLLEAFSTMIKFAPSLTTDINAVRSFLREVVLGGGNVNYAVVKNLIDTEKAHRR